jgi:DNA-3-methyladenine glycosylase
LFLVFLHKKRVTIAVPVIKKNFYAQNTLVVARKLLGKILVREIDGKVLSGMITETEAYCGEADSACHAHRGKTPRNAIMYGEAGHAYVYFTYGMHYLINIITGKAGVPHAVLLRAVLPLTGIEEMEGRRKRKGRELTNGPGKLCQAFGIDKSFYGWDLMRGEVLWLEDYKNIPAEAVIATPRIGIGYAREEDREARWRFLVNMEKFKIER